MFLQLLLSLLATNAFTALPANHIDLAVSHAKYGKSVDPWDSSFVYNADLTRCLRANGYQSVFIRGSNGTFDNNAVESIRNAHGAGLGVEIYMEPQPNSGVHGGQQLDTMIKGFSDNDIVIKSVWLKVSTATDWPVSNSTAFISDIVRRAKQLSLKVGIYTSSADWSKISGAHWVRGYAVRLWYYSRSADPAYTGKPNFDDFVSFGGYKTPMFKQWSTWDFVCGYYMNRNIFALGNPENMPIADGKIVVGGIGL